MKIVEKATVTETKEVTKDVICNRCGETCHYDKQDPNSHPIGLLNVQVTGGYFSMFPPDLERWEFDLCESCLGWLVSTFSVYPVAYDVDIDGRISGFDACESTKLLLTEGKLDDSRFQGWHKERYALAMARGASRSPEGSNEAKASAAAKLASEELNSMRTEARNECFEMHDLLNKLACPGSGSPIERLREMASKSNVSSVEGRVLDALRELRAACASALLDELVDEKRMAIAIDNAEAILSSLDGKNS